MAIKIHHGPNGSYKTSGAIQDDLIPAIKKGRVIITNVRGLTRERIFQVMPETPSSCDVINLDLEDLDDMERCAPGSCGRRVARSSFSTKPN